MTRHINVKACFLIGSVRLPGEDDPVLPVQNTAADVIVPGAGHALSMSHPAEVTAFLQDKMRKHT